MVATWSSSDDACLPLAKQLFDVLDALHFLLFVAHHAEGACTKPHISIIDRDGGGK